MRIITRKRLNDFAAVHPDAHLWPSMAPVLYVPHTEEEYLRIVALLDQLIDEVGEEESHPLASLMEILGVLIEAYELEHVPEL